MKDIRQELSQHLGGSPSTTQRLLIDRIAMMMLRMELMDREALNGTPMTDRDQRSYLGWSNAVSRSLRHLGLKGTAAAAPTLKDYFAAKPDAAE